MKITMTMDMAWAAAIKAGTRRMKKHGRTNWSRGDYNFAVREFDRILPDPEN